MRNIGSELHQAVVAAPVTIGNPDRAVHRDLGQPKRYLRSRLQTGFLLPGMFRLPLQERLSAHRVQNFRQ